MSKENRRERKKLEAKERIINSALGLFFRQGYLETSIAQIMEEADLGTGTFYNYFQSKEDLIKYCIGEKVTAAMLAIRQLQEQKLPTAQKLAEIVQAIGMIFAESKPLMGLFMQLRRTNVEIQGLPSHNLLFKDILTEVFQQGQRSGEFKPEIPAEIVSEMIFGILHSTVISNDTVPTFFYSLEIKLNIFFKGILH